MNNDDIIDELQSDLAFAYQEERDALSLVESAKKAVEESRSRIAEIQAELDKAIAERDK